LSPSGFIKTEKKKNRKTTEVLGGRQLSPGKQTQKEYGCGFRTWNRELDIQKKGIHIAGVVLQKSWKRARTAQKRKTLKTSGWEKQNLSPSTKIRTTYMDRGGRWKIR